MKKGILYAAFAYIIWGFFPLYFNALHNVPAIQTLNHRIFWSFLLLVVVILARGEIRPLMKTITPKVIAIYLVAALLLAGNWFFYVWGVASGFVVETSLGYFINPLVSVLLGVLILRERMRPAQWMAIALATVGVIVIAIASGALPWIALALAFTFGTYGLMKKLAPLNSLFGLTLETALLFPIALVYLGYATFAGISSFGQAGWLTTLLLALTGIVTVIPLLLFASGARRIPLTIIGLLQYFAPTLQFLIGVFVYKEPMTSGQLIGFCVIWTALILFSVENFVVYRQSKVAQVANAS